MTSPSLVEPEYLSTRDAARQLGVAVRTIQLWVESGVLPAWKTAGGHRRIPKPAVDALLASRNPANASAPGTPVGAPKPPAGLPGDGRFRVLVVEDDPALQLLFEMMLLSWNLPLTVALADNGFSALLAIGERPPDLLISDLNMPGMDGFSMIRQLRQSPGLRQLPIIVISALGAGDIAARGGLPDDVPLFGKPVPFDRLEALLQAHVAAWRAG